MGYAEYDRLNGFDNYAPHEVHSYVLIPPTEEPVTLDLFKAHASAPDTPDLDDLFSIYISAAREWCEKYCKRSFATKVYQLTLDRFPCDDHSIRLWWPPVLTFDPITYTNPTGSDDITVQPITYQDTGGNWQTLDPSVYQADLNNFAPRIRPKTNQHWPSTADALACVKLTYTAGFATVPAGVISAILMQAASLYDNWKAHVERPLDTNPLMDSLLSSHRTF